jgi:NitT/TauT family transport system substrate-binding protein
MTRKRMWHYLVALSLFLTGAACTPPTGGQAPAQPSVSGGQAQPVTVQRATVKLGALSSASDSGLWIAHAKKYFDQEGLDVDVTTFASAADMVAPLGANQIDVGGGAPGVGLANAALRGIDIKIVADKAVTSRGFGYQGIVVRKDLYESGVRTPADLKGRKYGLPSTTGITPEVSLNKFMERGGLKARDLDLVGMAFPEMLTALANKAIDGATLIEPFITTAVERGDAVILERNDVTNPDHQVAVVLYSSEFAKKTDVANRFMTAYLKGVRDYNDAFVKKDATRRQEVIDILAEYTPIKDKPLYDKVIMPGLDPTGKVNVASLKADQEYYLAAGLQERPADFDKMIDMSFANAANLRLGAYR